jgi:imidazole glycerol-phosphate synthase subunit HisH
MVSIIDYGMGNLRSIVNALDFLGIPHRLVREPAAVMDAGMLILPGVGAFDRAMINLMDSGMAAAIADAARTGTPLLGICLGMQLLAERGEEGGGCHGLGLVPGTARRLRPESGVRIPHMGFNDVVQTRACPLFEGIGDRSDFYFAHSYYLDCDEAVVVGVAVHGSEFAAAIAHGNVMGTQFHPEKSQSHGLQLLRNFSGALAC